MRIIWRDLVLPQNLLNRRYYRPSQIVYHVQRPDHSHRLADQAGLRLRTELETKNILRTLVA